jgi:hypothetical protein
VELAAEVEAATAEVEAATVEVVVATAVVEAEVTHPETTTDDLLPLPETMMIDEGVTLVATLPGEMTTEGMSLEGMTEGKNVLPGETMTETGAHLDEMTESDMTVLRQASLVEGLRKYSGGSLGIVLRDL